MPSLAVPAIASGSIAVRDQPIIESDGLVLRPWRASDRLTLVAAYVDPAIRRWHCRSMDDDEARAWIAAWPKRWQAETDAGWAVVDADGIQRAAADDGEPPVTGDAIGQISLRRINLEEGLASVSYWVLPGARGRRVAPRALTALARWSFATVNLHRLEVSHSTLNSASCRVAMSAGFPAEGTKRSEALHADGWHDMHFHARLASDPE